MPDKSPRRGVRYSEPRGFLVAVPRLRFGLVLSLTLGVLACGCGWTGLTESQWHSRHPKDFQSNAELPVHTPPDDPEGARKWWLEYVDAHKDLDLLAVLAEASAVHKKNGTRATYKFVFYGKTMGSSYHYYDLFPVPIPDYVSDRIQTRLVGYAFTKAPDKLNGMLILQESKGVAGCSDQDAFSIWNEAEKKFGWTDRWYR